jgi:outer membrane protein TolC
MRLLVAVPLLLAPLLVAAAAPEPLTEAEAVERAVARPEVERFLRARADAARGRADAAGRWANPELEYAREGLDEPGGDSTDEFLWLRQRLNPAGARGLERQAAAETLAAEHARVDLARRDLVREVRERYHDAVAEDRRRAAHRAFRGRLDELVRTVEARAEAGEAAPYDALRLRRALAVAAGDAQLAEAEAAAARSRLAALVGEDAPTPAGPLLPPPADAVTGGADDPRLRALESASRAAELRARAASRDAWPDLVLGVGVREFEQGGQRFEGGLVSIGIEVPVFDRNRGEIDAARADAIALDAERDLALRRFDAEAAAATERLAAARAASIALHSDAEADAGTVERIAEAAWSAGELDVLALIDAHRSSLDARLRAIDHAGAARDAYIQLQYLGRTP